MAKRKIRKSQNIGAMERLPRELEKPENLEENLEEKPRAEIKSGKNTYSCGCLVVPVNDTKNKVKCIKHRVE